MPHLFFTFDNANKTSSLSYIDVLILKKAPLYMCAYTYIVCSYINFTILKSVMFLKYMLFFFLRIESVLPSSGHENFKKSSPERNSCPLLSAS